MADMVAAQEGTDPNAGTPAAPPMGAPTNTGDDKRPEPAPARAALVSKLLAEVQQGEAHWKDEFKQMRDDMNFAAGEQWPSSVVDDKGTTNGNLSRRHDDRYMVNLVLRHIKSETAILYAKHPVVTAERRPRLDFKLWDGTLGMLQQAQAELQQAHQMASEAIAAGQPEPPPPQQAAQLVMDVETGMRQRKQLDGVGRTLACVFKYSLDDQDPDFKSQMKRLVRRAITCGVGYLELDYQRTMQARPDVEARLSDHTERLATLKRLMAEAQEGSMDEMSAEAERLRIDTEQLQAIPQIVQREGLVFNFPPSTSVIPDYLCTQLDGFVGARWVAKKLVMSVEEIREVYGVDIGSGYTPFQPGNGERQVRDQATKEGRGPACVYELFHKKDGVRYVLCDGYRDLLEEPKPPNVVLARFWPFFPLMFNELEDEKTIFPPSDVTLMRHPQREYNRTREALRQHRIAARPLYLSPTGALEEEDRVNIGGHAAHDVILVNALKEGQSADTVLVPVKKINIDPNVYDTRSIDQDLTKAVGGGPTESTAAPTKTTATAVSSADSSRETDMGSSADALDGLLTQVARAAGQVLLTQMSKETVEKIAGPGAVWPEVTAQMVAELIYLDIEAGSSGRPNRAQDLANFERAAPFLLQIPGITPEWMAKYALKIMDANIDPIDAIEAGQPSIVSQNGQQQPGPANPANAPGAQGPAGAGNAAKPPGVAPGPQPAYPAGGEAVPGGGAPPTV